jgi:hypothetical protein
MQQYEVEYLQFAFRWMNNLLMRELPLRCTIRLWDTYQVQTHAYVRTHTVRAQEHTQNTHMHSHKLSHFTHSQPQRVCIILPLCSFIRPYPAEVIHLCQSSPLWPVPLALYLSISLSVCQQLRAMSPCLNTTELLLNKSLVNKPSFITPRLLPIPPLRLYDLASL